MKKIYVVGNPVKHSLSPDIHNYWLKKYDLNCVYEKLELEKNPEKLNLQQKELIIKIRNEEVIGINITVPFKQKFQEHIDDQEQTAILAKAINTIYKRGDKLIGANTDGIGFYNSLTQDFKCDVPKVIHILGAGGAAYGILSELLKHKIARVYISNRNKFKAEEMANYFKRIKSFSSTRISVKKSIFERPLSPVGMFINTSSIGMKGQEINYKKLDTLFSLLSKYAIVYDINYNQTKTIFNKLAEKEELDPDKIFNGKFMLIRQAAESFNKWFGIKLIKKDIDEGIKILEKFIS